MRPFDLRSALTALALCLLPLQCLAQTIVADVERVVGEVSAQAPDADRRALKAGDPVYLGDRLVTGSGALFEIAFRDRTRLTIGSGSEMTVKQYSAPESEQPSFLTEFTRGVFRVITGLIARKKPGAVRFVTPHGDDRHPWHAFRRRDRRRASGDRAARAAGRGPQRDRGVERLRRGDDRRARLRHRDS